MGQLTDGTPLSWAETKRLSKAIRRSGIRQFIHNYPAMKEHHEDILKWGDEIECFLVKFDHASRTAKLLLKGQELLPLLQKKEKQLLEEGRGNELKCLWRPEYSDGMIENSPGQPFGCLIAHLNLLEKNMNARRREVDEFLGTDERLLTMTTFPRLGCPGFTEPHIAPTPGVGLTESMFYPDRAVQRCYPRFVTFTRNMKERLGRKPIANVPIFKDKNTESPFIEDFGLVGEANGYHGEPSSLPDGALVDHIFVDALGFGATNCCLQVTFQACNLEEARLLFDQLANIAPIMLALTAAAPIFRGYLSDVDSRWPIMTQALDERTDGELGKVNDGKNHFRVSKSRFSSVSCYLSPSSKKFHDVPLEIDEELYSELRDGGVDDMLARHLAHLFCRDPLVTMEAHVKEIDCLTKMDNFENLQTSNWQTLRFKPPEVPRTPGSPGWRIEFRPCEVQFTDFENAAFAAFIVLLTRVILTLDLDFVIPMSKVNENMTRAVQRNAVNEQKFWFRSDFLRRDNVDVHLAQSVTRQAFKRSTSRILTTIPEFSKDELIVVKPAVDGELVEDSAIEMTMDEIFNGKDAIFPGLIPLVESYLKTTEVDVDTYETLQQYLQLISQRASGQAMTNAQWIREFVRNHPAYKFDSRVSDEISYDLLRAVEEMGKEGKRCPKLLGTTNGSKSADHIPESIKKITSVRLLTGVNA